MLQEGNSGLVVTSAPEGPKPLQLDATQARPPQIAGSLLSVPSWEWTPAQKKAALAYQTGDLVIDVAGGAVYKNGELLLLTKTEFQLLEVLIANSTIFCSRDLLIGLISRRLRHSIADNTLSKHICRLRRKLGQDANTEYLICQNKRGYKWNMVVFTRYIQRESKLIGLSEHLEESAADCSSS